MTGFLGWKNIMFLYCSGNVYRPDVLKSRLEYGSEFYQSFKESFEIVLKEKPFTAQAWEDEFDTSFDEDAELREHLQEIYDYLFMDGPFP